tara:strand:- start:581 stop:766 length:186 start_codon:yes stop_codon:yes gene_type:complete
MPMGKGTYGSQVGRPSKKEKREGKMDGGMMGKKKQMMYGGGRVKYMDGGPVMDNTPMAKPN